MPLPKKQYIRVQRYTYNGDIKLKKGKDNMSAVKDLTKGSPMKLILGFMLPMLLGLLFQQFYNMVDTIVVGQFLGVNALAGVGSTGSVNFLVLGFCMGVCAGFAIPVAQKFGEKDFDGLRKFAGNTIWLGIGFAAVMTTATCLLCGNILHWMNTPDTVFKEAYDYIFVIFLGIPVTFLYNILSGFIRSLGDSKSPVVILIISSILNVGFDLLFILVFDMGVAGAGWATVLAQLISGIACLVYMIKRFDILHLSRKDLKPDAYSMSRLCAMGVPMGLQYSITAIGTMMVQSALNMLGSYAVAAFTAGSKIEQIFTQAFVAQGTASATYNAQNIGAGKLERVREGFRASHFIGIIYSVVVGSFLFFAGKYFAYLFISDNIEEVLPMVAIYVKCVALFFIPLYFVNVLRNGIQGMGYGLLPMMAGVAELAGRGITATIAAGKSSYVGTCLASPVAWVFASVLLWGMYFYVMKDMSRKLYGTNKL